MKSFIAIPLVLASASAETGAAPMPDELVTRLNNMGTDEFGAPTRRMEAKYDLKKGATCAEGYEPLTASWQACAAAARSLGYDLDNDGEDVAYVKYNKPWGTTRPQGCFRKGNGQFHFNDGAGGGAKKKDRILCVLKGQAPINPNRAAGSSLESDIVIDTSYEEAQPEGDAPMPQLDIDDENNGGMVEHELGTPSNDTETAGGKVYRFYSETEGWTEEEPISRTVCGSDQRERVTNVKTSPWEWIVDLQMTTKNGNSYICSGFFISKRAIMTAGHCVYMAKEGGWVKSVKVCPGRNGNSFPWGCKYVNHMWTTNQWVQNGNSDYDYATMSLSDTSFYDKGVGYFGYTSNLSNVGGVNVAGYPGDKDGGTTLWWNYSSYTTTSRKIKYMADTAGGMSGGPVWAYYPSEGQRRIVGVHAYGGCPNAAVRVNGEVFDWMQWFRNNYN